MTDDRTRPHEEFEPRDGIWPGEAEWLSWEPPFETSRDFAQRVLGALGSDRAEFDPTAVPDLPRELLDAFAVPKPSADFVERTLDAIRAHTAGNRSTPDHAHRDPLDAYFVPAPSADFVSRTLAAIQAERTADRAAESSDAGPRLVLPRRRVGWLVAAAALVVGIGLFWHFSQEATGAGAGPDRADPRSDVVALDGPAPAAADHSPTLTGVAMARVLDPEGLVATAPDPLLLLARGELGR